MANALFLINECIRTQNPYLDLGYCGLTDELVAEGTEIDIALRQCTHLKTLILSNRWLRWDEGQEEWIERISSNNGKFNIFTLYPPALPILKNLCELHCSGANYKSWSIDDMSFVSELPLLIILNLSNNKIKDLKSLEFLTNLQELNIYRNKVSKIENLNHLINLKRLNIARNRVRHIVGIHNLTNLEYWDIYRNHIMELKGLDRLSKLKIINIYNNQITELKGLDNLEELKELNISSNKITKLEGLNNLKNLIKFADTNGLCGGI